MTTKKHIVLEGSEAQRKSTKELAKQFFAIRMENNSGTWDGPDLLRFKWHYLFVYNNMKTGFKRNSVLGSKAVPVCNAFTFSTMFEMYMDVDNGSPLIMTNPADLRSEKCGRIFGQVFRVPTSIIFDLDYYENNHHSMLRQSIPVDTIPFNTDVKGPMLWCWTYVGKSDYWNKHPKRLWRAEENYRNKDAARYFIFKKSYEDTYLKIKKAG